MEVVASLSQGRTAAAQCGLFTHKSVPVIFEPPCTYSFRLGTDWLLVATDTSTTPEVWSKSAGSSGAIQALLHTLRLSGVHCPYVPEFLPRSVHLSNGPEFHCCSSCLFMCLFYVFNDVIPTAIFILSQCLADDLMD